MPISFPLDRPTAAEQFAEVDAAYHAALDAGRLMTPQEVASLKLMRDAAEERLRATMD